MKLLLSAFLTILQLSSADASTEHGVRSGKKKTSKKLGMKIPEIGTLMDAAFPMWEVDSKGNRVEHKECIPSSCEWNPYYLTKRYDGLHPDCGGHPTDIDVGYAFYYASPFGGQAGGGSPHHCSENDDVSSMKVQTCPKVKTLDDNGPNGPGHIPPHISLASLTWAMEEEVVKRKHLFNYELYGCRVDHVVLFKMIRHYFPRTLGEVVDYPPPFTPEGGSFAYEFSSGRGIKNQEPPYLPGPPHWCTDEFKAIDHWADFCPYIHKGSDAGKYRHPHIAYVALEVYLANMVMPDKCGSTWLENNPDFLDQKKVTTNLAFPKMDADDKPMTSVDNWLGQPALPYEYPSMEDEKMLKKSVPGTFVTEYLYK